MALLGLKEKNPHRNASLVVEKKEHPFCLCLGTTPSFSFSSYWKWRVSHPQGSDATS
jgi:hypothetical protein